MKERRSRKKAIQAALGQLGWQSSAKDVVAHLARYGIDVSEGLVSKVRIDGLKKTFVECAIRQHPIRMRLATFLHVVADALTPTALAV